MSFRITLLLSLFFLSLLTYSCSEDSLGGPDMENMEEENAPVDGETWDGNTIIFTKANDADPTAEANQDRITDKVWITRGNGGGQIYNAVTESDASKSSSPAGTEWAVGTLDEVNSLDFKPFRTAVGSPKNIVGKNLVLHLIEDDIYISVKFRSWAQQKGGGFSYERSTQP